MKALILIALWIPIYSEPGIAYFVDMSTVTRSSNTTEVIVRADYARMQPGNPFTAGYNTARYRYKLNCTQRTVAVAGAIYFSDSKQAGEVTLNNERLQFLPYPRESIPAALEKYVCPV